MGACLHCCWPLFSEEQVLLRGEGLVRLVESLLPAEHVCPLPYEQQQMSCYRLSYTYKL